MTRKQLVLDPYVPGQLCPKCGAEGGKTHHHARAILAVFGGAPQWPCSGLEMDGLGEHMCLRCETCGHSWLAGIIPGIDAAMLE